MPHYYYQLLHFYELYYVILYVSNVKYAKCIILKARKMYLFFQKQNNAGTNKMMTIAIDERQCAFLTHCHSIAIPPFIEFLKYSCRFKHKIIIIYAIILQN